MTENYLISSEEILFFVGGSRIINKSGIDFDLIGLLQPV